jgi:hypothetical protein
MPRDQKQVETQPAKHTPGPWHISQSGTYVRKSNGSIGDGPKDFNVAEVNFPEDPEGRANARLIAAAPELLYALQSVLACFNRHGYARKEWMHPEFANDPRDIGRLVSDAVAAAEGPVQS